MRKVILATLAIAILASCSKNDSTADGTDANRSVPIKLHSGIELATKAPITSSETVAVGGWESSAGGATYTEAATWQSTAAVDASASTASITLNPVQYYNKVDQTKSYIKGWYPAETPTSGVVAFTNTDGLVDAILSNEVSGSKRSEIANALTFEHVTAQLKFMVVKGVGLAAGTTIKAIKVKGASLPTAFDLSKVSTAAEAVRWTAVAAGGLAVSHIIEAEITSTPAQDAGDPVMIQPVGDNTTIKLDVVTSLNGADATFSDVLFATKDGAIAKGKSYTITLTFTQSGVAPTANITDWTVAVGSGTVQ